ncbi:MAG: alpha/beta fold hydrolase, partial [Acidobacteriota bacterium]|nr:alpha/beta fold hydrolase [Acidobacteriota bacterium]
TRAGGASGGAQGGGVRGGGASASQEFVRKEERQLIEAVREREEQREEQERERRARERRRPFTLSAGQSVAGLLLSPDGTYVVAIVAEPSAGRNTIVPNYVSDSGYTEEIQGRTKVGDLQGRTRLAVVSVATGEVKWVETGLQRAEVAPRVQTRTEQNATGEAQRERGVEDEAQQAQQTGQQSQQLQQSQQQTGIQSRQTGAQSGQQSGARSQQGGQQASQSQQGQRAQSQQTEATSQGARDREVQLFQLQWSEDGTRAVLMARASDNKDRWVMSLDPQTARTRVLARIHDEAWVGGPGSFTLGWLPDNRRVYFVSERDGWAHLYTVSTDGGEPVQLTSGKFEVSDVRLSADKTKFYFTSSERSLFERDLYSMPLDGGARTRLTTMAGNNQVDVSPDERLLAVVRSYSNKPPELYIQPNRPAPPAISASARESAGAASSASAQASDVKQVTTSPTPEFFTYPWIDPPVVSFRARDGATVYGRLYKPANFRRGGPAVLFVHGAGYLQDVTKWWSSYYREFMFQHLLMERGFLVFSIDYRGSAGYGRDWRTGIYRHMGGKDLDDHVDAVRYLVTEHGVDPRRVGIYGGSYGGFMTLMAMFTTPDIFAAGAALRPVTDWAHYNNGYTSNILNDPQDDPVAYRQSSPIYFAQGLKGTLLICHGMVDTNVNFQDTVRLTERLIELRKENWQLAAYPVEDHTFERADSWADEYKRILKLFSEQLHPDAGPPPAGQRGKESRR